MTKKTLQNGKMSFFRAETRPDSCLLGESPCLQEGFTHTRFIEGKTYD